MQPGEVSRYGTTQNPDAARTTADALFGTPVGHPQQNAAIGSAAGFSTAPYVPPKIPSREGLCRAKNNTCKARVVGGTELCIFHSPGQGRHDRIGEAG
jgi:hypothetical protein